MEAMREFRGEESDLAVRTATMLHRWRAGKCSGPYPPPGPAHIIHLPVAEDAGCLSGGRRLLPGAVARPACGETRMGVTS